MTEVQRLKRPKDFPRVVTPSTGDALVIDGTTGTRSIAHEDFSTYLSVKMGAFVSTSYTTKSAMDSDHSQSEGTLAAVSSQTDPSNAGTYRYTSGSWVFFAPFVDDVQNNRLTALEVFVPDIQMQVVVDLGGSDGGHGTDISPFSPTDFRNFIDVQSSLGRHSLLVVFKGDHYRGAPFKFDMSKWRNVEMHSITGKDIRLYASKFVSAGSSYFTQPDAVNYPNVWMCDNPYEGTTGSTSEASGLIDIDASQACGVSGTTRSPYTLYTDLGNDAPIATMNSTAYRTGYSLRTTGPNAGKLYVHARGSFNPNTINFEQSIYDYCLYFYCTSGSTINAGKVKLTGIFAAFARGAGIWADRCEVDWDNCTSQFNIGYGFNPNQCYGRITSCTGQFNQIDHFNGNGGIADNSSMDHDTQLVLVGCRGIGCTQTLAPLSGIQRVGDAFSNHVTQNWILVACTASAPTKDGYSMTNSFTLSDCFADDCVIGATLASQDGKQVNAVISGGRLSNCTYGIHCNAQGTSETAQIDVYQTIIDSSATASILLSGNTKTTINAWNVSVLGTPTSGHKHNSSTFGGSAINVLPITLLT